MGLRMWVVLFGLALAACGGGDGGGGGGGDDNSWLSFTPSPVVATTHVGEPVAVTVTARSNQTISEPLNVIIVDKAGVITTNVRVDAISQTEYRATLEVASTLAAGTYEGHIEVRLCRDAAATCSNPYPGSPWLVPYRFAVLAGSTTTALRPLAGAGAWTTYQGNAAHTGYVTATVDPAKFSRRFSWPNEAGSVAVEEGRIFATSGSRFGNWTLRALSEADGQVLWSSSLGTLHHMNPPAVSNGRVYVTSAGHSDSYFWTFDAAMGAPLSSTAMQSQCCGRGTRPAAWAANGASPRRSSWWAIWPSSAALAQPTPST